ncbi:MAG: phospholipase D family protein [Thermoproteota archaeon]|nr:phospholipase D family protein [Thermoproteota archaeon]
MSEITEKYSNVQQILSIVASPDVFRLFSYADRGFVLSVSLLEKLQMSNKQYYKALHKLKLLGLLEKRDGVYHHSISGSILYKQVVQQIAQLSKHEKEFKIINVLKSSGQFSDDEIRKFVEQITKDDDNASSVPGGVHVFPNILISHENIVKTLCQRIEKANNEILIATRISMDEVIASLIESIKLGVKVRVLVDERLIAEYRRFYYPETEKSDSPSHVDRYAEERIKVVENPWYQSGVKIERRVGKVPFGLIILDKKEVGIELVDSYNPDKFSTGILLKDSRQVVDAMLKQYEEMWCNSHSV